jgi:Tol biopolymer transport system component
MSYTRTRFAITVAIALFLIASFLPSALFSQDLETLNSGRIIVREFRDLGELGKDVLSLAWSTDGTQLLVDKKASGLFYGIFSIDLTTQSISNLGKGTTGIGSGYNANSASPVSSSDGRHILFCAQLGASNKYNRTEPGYGLHNDLWVKDLRNNNFHRLHRNGFSMSNPKGTVFPHFSPDGKHVLWTAVLGQARSGSVMGRRGISMAEFELNRHGTPKLGKIEELIPGLQQDFFEAYGFTPDGKQILLSANLSDRQPWFGMDLYYLDLDTREFQALTETSATWDRFASLSPKGEKITWSTSMGLTMPNFGPGGRLWEKYLSTELWIMNKDGSEKKRLTAFNQRGSKEYTGVRSVVGMSAWHPNGREIAMVLLKEGRNYELESSVLILELGDTFAPIATP